MFAILYTPRKDEIVLVYPLQT